MSQDHPESTGNTASVHFLRMGKGRGVTLSRKPSVLKLGAASCTNALQDIKRFLPAARRRNPGTPRRTPKNLGDPLTTFWAKLWSTIHSHLFKETKCHGICPLRTLFPGLTKTWWGYLVGEKRIQARHHFVVEMPGRNSCPTTFNFRNHAPC